MGGGEGESVGGMGGVQADDALIGGWRGRVGGAVAVGLAVAVVVLGYSGYAGWGALAYG